MAQDTATTAPGVKVFGPALVQIEDFAIQDTWRSVGYTRNGVDQTDEAFWLDVPGDQHGGDDGPPIDIQFLGEIARVRCELTKWNVFNVDRIRSRVNAIGAAPGYVPCNFIGGLMIAGSGHFRLQIVPTCLQPDQEYYFYTFHRAIPRAPIEVNHATKFATMILEFECHRDPATGLIYNHSFDTYGTP